ncbi:CRISPR-associated endoribonuclease Cas6, partial [Clostridium sp. 3-3]|uniref:CRISPR-associated endoribonuclease Cas6 n=1 Tax=Clostridium sp. 3-3 TaxID=2070757 RepID=UPI000CDA3622
NDAEVSLDERCILTISTSDYVLGSVIYNSFINSKEFVYKDKYKLNIGKVVSLKEKNIASSEVVFKTMSPIAVRNKNGEFLDVKNNNYEQELNYITNEVLKSCRGTGLKEKLKFEPVMMKKRVIKEKISKVSKTTNKNIFYITGYEGIFKLTGNKDDLNMIYKLGLGFRRSSGCGCLEIV